MNEYKNLIISLILFVVISLAGNVAAFSQDKEVIMEEVFNGYVAKVDIMLFSNLLFLQQFGNENEFVSIQEQQEGTSNNITSFQDGLKNSAYIHQAGSELDTHLEQYNSSNKANLWSSGSNIQTIVSQNGSYNTTTVDQSN